MSAKKIADFIFEGTGKGVNALMRKFGLSKSATAKLTPDQLARVVQQKGTQFYKDTDKAKNIDTGKIFYGATSAGAILSKIWNEFDPKNHHNIKKIINFHNKPLIFDIFINNNFFKTVNLKETSNLSFSLKTDNFDFKDSINLIDFKIKNPVTPISILESVDGRLLGFLIKDIEFK